MSVIQATRWTAQLNDGTKMQGGQEGLIAGQYEIAAVPVELLKVFTISHNTFTHTYYVPLKTWYKDGKTFPAPGYIYPTQYIMQDNSLLTVDVDQTTNLLKLSQVYPEA